MMANPRHFTISASCGGHARRETRAAAASAMVLADTWADEGCGEILLTDPQGRGHSPEAFRRTLRSAIMKLRHLTVLA